VNRTQKSDQPTPRDNIFVKLDSTHPSSTDLTTCDHYSQLPSAVHQ
jgi:hypothetical protein